jgi:methionine synthase II (cobalamin-independent)
MSSKHFHIVGSLLRPAALLQYKRQIEQRDDITYPFYDNFAGYEATEADAIREVVAQQIEHGVVVLTDGEFSKSLWHLDFVWGLQGVSRYISDHGYLFVDKDPSQRYETRRDIGLRITGELSGKNHHFIKIYQKLQSFAGGRTLKQCVPSPAHIFGELLFFHAPGRQGTAYADKDALKAGLIKAYKEFTEEFAAIGGKILQLDDCLWELFAHDNPRSPFGEKAAVADELKSLGPEFVDINNTLIDFGHGLGLQVWTHNCRGNYASRHFSSGSYLAIADLFLKQQKYDSFFLEWDDDRAGSIEALKAFADGTAEVVLGLLSSKTNTLDNEERVLQLLNEAAKIIPKERLFLSHQCGFASCDGGNELTQDEQWAKIDQGQKLALAFWGE